MLRPNEVAERAKQKEEENYRFRTYLKAHADPDKLDVQFKRLHEELFPQYDCSACRNCCKMFCGVIPEGDIERDASYLGLSREEFIGKYLEWSNGEEAYMARNCPCDFWDENSGECILAECKPESCVKYPYTDQPDRWGSLFSIIESAAVCPVVYEILERLKVEYHFAERLKADDYFAGRSRKKVYPNDPCPCGSGKKYKNCCGR